MARSTGMGLVAAALLASACAMPKTPKYEPDKDMGMQFCADIANHAQSVSTQEMGLGVFLLTVGGASITASGVLATISANADQHRELLGYVGAGLAVAPLIGVPFGMVLLSRSDEASALAAASNTAVALAGSDQDAFRDCVLAKAAWVGSRADATALARQALEEEREKEQERKDAAEEEGEKAEEEEPQRDDAGPEEEDESAAGKE